MSDEEQELSALRDSIKRKGNNSYYYAHAPQTVESVPAPTVWDGKEEPKLLAVTAPSSSTKSALPIVTLEYSYADDNKNVKIYIEFPDADSYNEDQIKLECEGITHTSNIP